MQRLLEVRNLTTEFRQEQGTVRAVDKISFELYPGETLGLVGESGSGKSVTALSLMRLVPDPPGKIHPDSDIKVQGRAILKLSEQEMQAIRGAEMAMIFQDAMTALNPVYSIGNLMREVLMRHHNISKREAHERSLNLLTLVGIPEPAKRLDSYVHQMSGGMRQRVMIAMALSCNPKVLIADEPTTALDVTIQSQILALISQLQKEISMAVILITHDLSVVAETCDRVLVMYCGKIIEEGEIHAIFAQPLHPYTQGLLDSIPRMGHNRTKELKAIPGMVPDLLQLPPGCRFADRCFRAEPKCFQEIPETKNVSNGRRVACFFPLEGLKL